MGRGKPYRITISPGKVSGSEVIIAAEDCRHLEKVLRLGDGDLVRATDGMGTEYTLRLKREETGIRGDIVEVGHPRRESPLSVTLLQALPKGDLMAQVIQKAVELGVTAIYPVTTARTAVTAKEGRYQGKQRRWQKIVDGAVAQSGRTRTPTLAAVQSWEQAIREAPPSDLRIVLLEREPRGLADVLREKHSPASVQLAIGPEGGWEKSEIEGLREADFVAAGVGPRIFRTGTAGLAAISIVQYLFGDLGCGWTSAMDSEKPTKAL